MELETKETESVVNKKEGVLVNLKLSQIVPYKNNAKIHTNEQIGQIRESIQEFGYKDLIAVDENNVILEGHGRLKAFYQLDASGNKTIPVWKIIDLNESQKKAYRLTHNNLNMLTGFDQVMLAEELKGLKEDDFDIEVTGFNDKDIFTPDEISSYTDKIKVPIYEPSEENPDVAELVDDTKTLKLLEEIEKAKLPVDVEFFLTNAAYRHLVFNYKRIADYYSHASPEIQNLMEKSALVLIDFKKAIEGGFIEFAKTLLGDEE